MYEMAEALQKNRYAAASRNADWTIDQNWKSYSDDEHDRWRRLFTRQAHLLEGRACDAFFDAKEKLALRSDGIPDFRLLSDRLEKLTGWRIAPVAGLIPDDAFFAHLAARRFPAGAFIRPEKEIDYLSEPDVFHDVDGHVPLLADPAYARFLESYGKGGLRALRMGRLHNLARLYWYTVEFGLIASDKGLRIFGAGILSSPGETIFSLTDSSPNRIAFDLERVMRTAYIISDYQQSYFVIDSFESLLEACYEDFSSVYERLGTKPDIAPDQLTTVDRVIHIGDLHYFRAKGAAM